MEAVLRFVEDEKELRIWYALLAAALRLDFRKGECDVALQAASLAAQITFYAIFLDDYSQLFKHLAKRRFVIRAEAYDCVGKALVDEGADFFSNLFQAMS